MDELDDFLVKLHLKSGKRKRRKKYSVRGKYLSKAYMLLGAFLTILMLSFATSKHKDDLDTSALGSDTNVVGTSNMYRIDTKWDPTKQLLITQYFIGNKNDVDAVDDDAKLANLTYKTYGAVPETTKTTPTTETIKVNDHYIVVVSKGVGEGFTAIQYQMKPEAINKSLGVGEASTPAFILKENNLTRYRKLRVESKDVYQTFYYKFLIKNYKIKLNKATKSLEKSQSRIKANDELIEKLKAKQMNASDSDATDLQEQIDDINDQIKEDKDNIISQSKTKDHYEKRIASVQSKMAF